MMPIIYASTKQQISERERRSSLFDGDFFVYGPKPSTRALSDYAASTIEQMLGAEPPSAQQRMSESEFSILFNVALRNFRHRESVMALVQSLVSDFGCDPTVTYFSY